MHLWLTRFVKDLSTLQSATKGLLVSYDKGQLRKRVGHFLSKCICGSRKDWQAWETRLIKIRSVSNCLQWGSIGVREKRVHDNQGTLDIPRLQIKSIWPCESGNIWTRPPPNHDQYDIHMSIVQGIWGQVNSFTTTLQLLSSATSTTSATPSLLLFPSLLVPPLISEHVDNANTTTIYFLAPKVLLDYLRPMITILFNPIPSIRPFDI